MRVTLLSLCALIVFASPSMAWRLKELPNGYSQMDLMELKAQLFTQHPTASVFGLVTKSNKGVKANREGKVEYRTPGMLHHSRGWVQEFTSERMCFTHGLSPNLWTCVSVYRKGNDYICKTEIKGRDVRWYWQCAPKAFPKRRL